MTMIISILIGAPAGYALSRFDIRGKEVFRLLILLTRAFPLPPLAVMFIQTGLDDTVFGLALVHTTLAIPFAVLITFSLFSGIPIELEEAAWTLGCARVTAFTKVVLPLILSGITEPPIEGFAIRRIHDRALQETMATAQARALLPRIHAWHQWFYRARDPQGTGLVAQLHPRASGRDNSADWDDAFSRVPTEGVGEFTRRDTTHANPAHGRAVQALYLASEEISQPELGQYQAARCLTVSGR